MRSAFARSGAVAAGVLTLSGAGVLAFPLAANAAPECATTVPAATLIAPGVCEIRISASGVYTFPAGIAKLSAVLVAGGGGGFTLDEVLGYAGEGGKVEYIDAVPLGTPLNITVGTAGAGGWSNNVDASTPTNGGDTIVDDGVPVIAAGGLWGTDPYGANGAAGPSAVDFVGGPGYLLENVPGADVNDELFPDGLDTVEYGRGGNGYDATNVDTPAPEAAAPTDTGAGGHGALAGSLHGADGVAGIVILRFAPQEPIVPPASGPALAATGIDALPGIVGAVGRLAVGGILLAARRRPRDAG